MSDTPSLVPPDSTVYHLRVNDPPSDDGGGKPVSAGEKTRRRRRPNPQEQAKREAWGREWGQVMAEHAKERGWK